MLWGDCLKRILGHQTILDGLTLSVDGKRLESMPTILKASILMTDKMLDSGRKNMFVFPEQQMTSFVYMLLRTLYNIAEGRIKKDYDPYSFVLGEKLRFKSSVVEFVGIDVDKRDGVKRIFVRFSDGMKFGMPLETAPFLQHVQTKRLSKFESFRQEYHPFIKDNGLDSSKAFLHRLSDYKTHLDSATVFVAPILNTKKKLLGSRLDDEKISDFLLLAQLDVDGNTKNMTAGQLSGTPAIVLCQDLYTVCEAMKSGLDVEAIYIEATQALIDNQLDALDELLLKDKSIVILTDQMSFTDYSNLEARGFHIWTWNNMTIPVDICHGDSRIDIMGRNSATRKTEYIDVQCREISESLSLLYKNKGLMETQSAAVIQVYQSLFEIALVALRTVSPLTNRTQVLEVLDKCKAALVKEKDHLRQELFIELSFVADNLIAAYKSERVMPKANSIAEVLAKASFQTAYIIVPQNVDKKRVEQYLNSASSERYVNIIVVYPSEYPQQEALAGGLTIVSGWLNRATMNRILNANITAGVITLVYEIEKRWKNGYLRNSHNQLTRNNAMNASILKTISDGITADFEDAKDEPAVETKEREAVDSSELEDIELTLSRNKYRRYISPTQVDSVQAIPVSFVSDLISFYRLGRTILTATKLIDADYDKIEEIKPAEIQAGDFIIERETQRDIIRDIADIILVNSGYSGLREIARKWKEALEVESVFSDEDAIYEKLKDVGCTRGRMTVHNWIDDNDMITPSSKDDIVFIAKATEDSVLLEMVDQVFDAGKVIKSAHIQAGHHLADKLRSNLAAALSSKESIDGFNVWQPIELDIEDIGLVKLLKVIDVGSAVYVDASSTNRLIDTNRIIM